MCSLQVEKGKRIGYYSIRGILGKGAFGEVKLGLHMLLDGKYQTTV